MSSQTIYIKIDKNVLVHNRNITLGDIAKIECTDVGMLRKIRQKKVYSFQGTHAKKNQFQVFSILKIIQLIHVIIRMQMCKMRVRQTLLWNMCQD